MFTRPRFKYGLFLAVSILTVLAWFFGYWLLASRRVSLSRVYLQSQTDAQIIAWNAMLNSHKEAMQAYFHTIIMRPKIMKSLENGDRQELYKLLKEEYKFLQRQHVRQLHFHTADNHSFLRFHAPEYYGDSLVKERPSVVRANKTLEQVTGFETGRVVVGFRNIFPIVWNGRHLGSVELSQPFEAIRQDMQNLDPKREFQLLFRKEMIWPKLIEDWKKQYIPSCIGSEWVVESPFQHLDSAPAMSLICTSVIRALNKRDTFRLAFKEGKAATFAADYKGSSYKITLIPQIDIEGNRAAVMISFAEAPELATYRKNFINNMVIQTFLLLFGGIMLYLYLFELKVIKEKQRDLCLITSTIGDGIYVIDKTGRITFTNPRASELLGYTHEELAGSLAHELFHRSKDEVKIPISECPLFGVLDSKVRYEGEEHFDHKDGRSIPVYVATQPMFNGNEVVGSVTVFRDISEYKEMEQQLRLLSITDPLTGVYNRRFLQETLLKELYRAERHGTPLALIMLDIDHFKQINDRYGHDSGDKVLQNMVRLIKGRIRASDCLARWGGEEFLLLLPNTVLSDAVALSNALLEAIRLTAIHDVETITASFGVACYRLGDSVETILLRADNQMYAAKEAGRNCVRSEDR